MKLVNYSHPLSAAAKTRLEEMVGESVEETVIPVQLDLDAPLRPQLDVLVDACPRHNGGILYMPPSLAAAAAYVTARLSYAQSDAMRPEPPRMVVLRRDGINGFMPSEIL